MADHEYEKSPERFAIEQAIARVDAESSRIDAYMIHVKWIVSVVSSIVIVVIGSVSFLGLSSLSDISAQVASDAQSQVRQAIQGHSENIQHIENLTAQLSTAVADYEKSKEAIQSLSVVNALAELDLVKVDPSYSYKRLSTLEKEETTPQNRGAAFKLVASLIESGLEGTIDSNTLFNASVSASRLDFNFEAVKLAVLAEHWFPSVVHRALKAQHLAQFGRDFTVQDGALVIVEDEIEAVRARAWQDLLGMVGEVYRAGSEQVYSRASNVAVRFRSYGYQRELAQAIERSSQTNHDKLTSYAYATLAKMYAWQGDSGWEPKYWRAVESALVKLKEEPPTATWFDDSVSDLLRNANRIDRLDELIKLSKALGYTEKFWSQNAQRAL